MRVLEIVDVGVRGHVPRLVNELVCYVPKAMDVSVRQYVGHDDEAVPVIALNVAWAQHGFPPSS
jgi:hypothetical protein